MSAALENWIQIHLDTVTSTMDMAREKLKDADLGLITAKRQTRGRGSQGRSWVSPAGNLYLTFAIRLSLCPALRLQTMALEASLALYQALQGNKTKPLSDALWIKWPNDLLWEENKVAGLLLEVTGSHLLLGAGINLEAPPQLDDGGRKSAGLTILGWNDSRRLELAEAFAINFQKRLALPWSDQVKKDLIAEWSRHSRWNHPIRLRDRLEGAMAWPMHLDDAGHLWVKLENGKEEKLIAEYLW